jgi:hypothetical protein
MELKTVFTSNIPVDCHILKNRLETEGLECFIHDENFIWVNPFRAVAIGGVKLKVPEDQAEYALSIIDNLNYGKLIDENGVYEMGSVFQNEINRQNEILDIKYQIRNDASLLDKPGEIKTVWLSKNEIEQLLVFEKRFLMYSNIKTEITWEQFWYELLDFDRDFFKYLKPRPVDYYSDKELVENYKNQSITDNTNLCPHCKSENVSYGYAIDFKWDIAYLILSFLFLGPFPLTRKKYHCFSCGYNYRNGIGKNN